MQRKTFDYGRATHSVIPMNNNCIGVLSHRGVGALPRSSTSFLDALALAGNIATGRRARPRPATLLVAGTSSPTAPKTSRTPVRCIKNLGLGNAFGTTPIRSSLVFVKWALAVNRNITASAHAADTCQVEKRPTPNTPRPLKSQRHQEHACNDHEVISPQLYVHDDIVTCVLQYVNVDRLRDAGDCRKVL